MLTFNSSCYTVKLLHCAHLRCSCCRTWSPTEDRETQKVVSEQEHGWWQAACMWGGFANEKPLCPQWRLTLWFREAGSVSCLPCTFPIRSLCQASAEQSSPCDWEAGRETEGESKTEKGRTKGRGGALEVQICRVTSGSYVMQVFPFCLPHPGFWYGLHEEWW